MSDDRLSNPIAEAGLLGAMLLDNRLIIEWSDRLRAEHFSDALHGRIYTALLRFAARGVRADAVTLRPVFQADQEADYGVYLDKLIETPLVIGAASSFADQVIDFAGRRAARLAMHVASEALSTDFDRSIGEITGTIDETVWAIESNSDVVEALDIGQLVGLAEERDDRIATDTGAAGMTNALVSDLDRGMGPLEPGTYTIIAGRPGMGKSALASSMALGYALAGSPGLYLQGEMTREQQGLRVAADLSQAFGAPLRHEELKKGGLSAAQRRTLAAVRERAALLPLRYVAVGHCDVRRIWSLAARHKALWAARGKTLGFVVVDYLGLLEARDPEGRLIENDRQRMNAVSRTLMRMKDELGVAVIALAQLSRAVEQRQNRRPLISDLKESGNLEQDADTVILLHREEYYLADEEPKRGEVKQGKDLHEQWEVDMNIVRGKVDLIFGKNRHGRKSTRTARFIGEHYAVRGADHDDTGDVFDLFDQGQPT